MAPETTLSERVRAAWNTRDSDAFAALFVDDGVRHEWALPGTRVVGRDAISIHVRAYMDAVPDCALDIRSVLECDDRMILEWTFLGTHAGDLPGLPAAGEAVALPGVSVCDVREGLLLEERVYWDAATLLAGAGVIT